MAKIKFSPLFFIYVFLCVYFGWYNQIFYYIVVVTLHEYGHYFMIKHYGYKTNFFMYSINGAGVITSNNYKLKDEIVIALAGPIVNVFLIIITISLWWIFPQSYIYSYDFFICNLVVLVFNLMPIYPLDGGRIITCIMLIKKVSNIKVRFLNNLLCVIFSCIFFVLFVVSIFYKINYNLLIISLFMTINYGVYDKNMYFNKISSLCKISNKPIEIKYFLINSANKLDLIKYLNPHYYSIFKVIDSNKNSYIIEEKELLK